MKKVWTLAFAFVLMLSLLSIPAYALANDQSAGFRTNDGTDSPFNPIPPVKPLNTLRPIDGTINPLNTSRPIDGAVNPLNTSRPIDGTYKRTDGYRPHSTMNEYKTNRIHTNNYRTTALDNNRGTNWGWLGLIGLAGLFGLRSRERGRS